MKYIWLMLVLISSPCLACYDGVHLIILSGQSNMSRMPLWFFTDALHGEIGTNHTIVVKYAIGGQPISMWDETQDGRIYKALINKTYQSIDGREITDVTFIWMQGEADVCYNRVDLYQESFNRLLDQIERDLDWPGINLIIGRINDWGSSPAWNQMRDLQALIGDTYPNAVWVDTDDFNGPYDGVHLTPSGYRSLAEAYAEIILGYEWFKD